MRKVWVIAAALLAAVLAALMTAVPSAADEGTSLRGILVVKEDGKDVAVVAARVTVTNTTEVAGITGPLAPGAFTGDAVSDGTGKWSVIVPGAGSYSATLDVASLPEGVGMAEGAETTLTVSVLDGTSKSVLFRLDSGEAGGGTTSTAARALQLTVDGLLFGLVIALAAIGLSLIFGTTGLTNFSHGELITLGALSTYFFNAVLELPFIISAAGALVVCAVLGGIQDRLLWRNLRRRGTGLIAMLVVSIGFGILLRYIYLFFFGGNTRQFRSYVGQSGIELGPVVVTPKGLIAAGVAIFFLLATAYWLLRTRSGKASRAIADNPALASASGIDVEHVINRVWIYGAGLAALSGIIYSLNNGVSWIQGFQLLLLVFAGVTLGGLGTAFGAIVGSLIVGVMIQVSTLFVPPELKNVGALAILIIILMVRPQGILGRRERVG